MANDLSWLPTRPDWTDLLDRARQLSPAEAFKSFRLLANTSMDFVRAGKLDKAIQRYIAARGTPPDWTSLRLSLLSSSTTTHLLAGIRLGALRRGVVLKIYEAAFGQYRQEINDSSSALHRFQPHVVCLALDARHLAGTRNANVEQALNHLQSIWREVQEQLGCTVIQQTILPVFPPLLGNNENQWPRSPAAIVEQLNHELRSSSAAAGVTLFSVDRWAAQDGIAAWHDAALWNRSKQEVHPRVSNSYGDQLGRLLAAMRGRSSKVLVLDLDNTLWGGVIGDDGLDGILLGQGSAVGEAHLDLQRYALQLSQRGVVLGVCSKNDETNAFAAFDQHPEMLLRRQDIACFVANWSDKATNLRQIAATLNVGLDSLVFVDDNPAERALVRRELPMVAVPELPEDPAGFVGCLAAAGYFEALSITADDSARVEQYRANAERDSLRQSTTDLDGFLRALGMELVWSSFDTVGLTRIVQLMNKTNQFNLTTRRYTEAEVSAMLDRPDVLSLQFRLTDVYGDNGIIGIIVGRGLDAATLEIESWLMSCRVLGRTVEEAALNVLADRAKQSGYRSLVGLYRPTAKNSMVAGLYDRLGFNLSETLEDGSTRWTLDLHTFTPRPGPVRIVEANQWKTAMSIAS